MIGMRVARVVFASLLFLVCTSCGETYRPVAFPIIPTPPNPGTFHYILTFSANGMDPSDLKQLPTTGTATRFDTSGDSIAAETDVGFGPVHAAVLPSGNAWYAANYLEDTISVSTTSASSTHTTIVLPDTPGITPTLANPIFVTTTEADKVYVANYNYGTVSVINTGTNVVIDNINVAPPTPIPNTHANPVVLAELPNAQKIYSVNQGNGTVTSINTVDDSIGAIFPVGSTPVWAAARSDSQRVYVLDKASGNIFVIDPTTTPDTLLGTVATAGGADFMLYDGKLNRLYVLSSTGNALWAFDVSASMPMPLLTVPKSMVPSSANPCATAPVPVSLTALADGSRIYVASYQKDGGTICSQVSVFGSSDYTPGNVIPLGAAGVVTNTTTYPAGCDGTRPTNSTGPPLGFRISIASSSDNEPTTRVYVADCDQGNTSIITTVAINAPGEVFAADSLVTQINAPLSAFQSPSPSPTTNLCPDGQPPQNGVCLPPPQNPLFIVAGP